MAGVAAEMTFDVPFEGVEKRLVVQFGTDGPNPLSVTENDWKPILDAAGCEIVSSKVFGDKKVYLLSESTLTVWSTGFLMKTCGRTTPFLGFKMFCDKFGMEFVLNNIQWITYSRLDFLHPEYQVYPHQNFQQELAFITQFFEVEFTELKANGQSMYVLLHVPKTITQGTTFHMEEALCLGIDPHCVRSFAGFDNAAEKDEYDDGASSHGAMRSITLEGDLDEFWFDPCGYSCNALSTSPTTTDYVDYFSSHISPEPATSYASLELCTQDGRSGFGGSQGLQFQSLIPHFKAKRIHVIRLVVSSTCNTAESRTVLDDFSKLSIESNCGNRLGWECAAHEMETLGVGPVKCYTEHFSFELSKVEEQEEEDRQAVELVLDKPLEVL